MKMRQSANRASLLATFGWLSALLVGWFSASPETTSWSAEAVSDSEVVHNVHVTYTELGVSDRYVAARIKYFKHDLEDAVEIVLKKRNVSLKPEPHSDSLYIAYLDSTLVLTSGGKRLSGRVVGSGEEKETEMWWYDVLFETDSPVAALEIENTQLLELFKDQKNILKAEHLASGKRRSFYFARRVTHATFTWD